MKEPFLIKANIADKITYYHLAVFVVSLPFNRLYSELALGSLLVHILIHFRKENLQQIKMKAFLIPAAIYILTMIGTIYTKYAGDAFSEWERQAAIVLFPLIVWLNPFDFRKYLFNIILLLAFGCALTILCLYFSAFQKVYEQNLPVSSIFSNAFLNHNFSAPIDMHATFFSMYISLAASAVIYVILESKTAVAKYFYGFVGLVLILGLIQLSSRAVLIAFALVINIVVPIFWIEKKKRLVFICISVLVTGSLFFAFTKIDNLKTRFIVELKEDLTQKDATNNLLEPRVVRWASAKDLMLQSPVYGHGSGSEIPLLKEVYYQHRLYNSYLNSLNIHNQYLSMFIKTGVIGLTVLLFVLIMGFKRSFQLKDGLFCSFLLIISIVFFSENVLDGNKGIFFFAFFFSIFYVRKENRAIRR